VRERERRKRMRMIYNRRREISGQEKSTGEREIIFEDKWKGGE
jgi:hypothetical protein